jgi:hypothetical protein
MNQTDFIVKEFLTLTRKPDIDINIKHGQNKILKMKYKVGSKKELRTISEESVGIERFHEESGM